MFGLDFSDPETLWLNITNIALGVVTLLCFAVVAWGAATAVLARLRLRRRWALSVPSDDHIYAVPGLGTTMADGGEKLRGTSEEEE